MIFELLLSICIDDILKGSIVGAEIRQLGRLKLNTVPKDSQKYDTVVKKNLQEILPGLLNELLDTNYGAFQAANVEIPTTLNPKSDLIFLVEHPEPQLLHIEFQSGNDAAMPKRMYLYSALLYFRQEKNEVSVKQIVFYIGKEKMSMRPAFDRPDISFRYQVIDLRQFPYRKFIASAYPEAVIFAILGDLGDEPPEKVIGLIVEKLQNSLPDKTKLPTFLVDLEILAQLRNFDKIVQQMQETMLNIDLTKTYAFRQGEEKGLEKGIEKGLEKGMAMVVLNMHGDGQSVAKIARATRLPEGDIRRIIGREK